MLINNLMNWVTTRVPALWSEEGQDLAEYALVLVFIAVVAVLGITTLGGTISGVLTQINTGLGG